MRAYNRSTQESVGNPVLVRVVLERPSEDDSSEGITIEKKRSVTLTGSVDRG